MKWLDLCCGKTMSLVMTINIIKIRITEIAAGQEENHEFTSNLHKQGGIPIERTTAATLTTTTTFKPRTGTVSCRQPNGLYQKMLDPSIILNGPYG
jgi:hypothetical protein